MLRVVRELSQQELGAAAGMSRNFISLVERGTNGIDVLRLRRLAAALGVDLVELVAEPDDRPTHRARAIPR